MKTGDVRLQSQKACAVHPLTILSVLAGILKLVLADSCWTTIPVLNAIAALPHLTELSFRCKSASLHLAVHSCVGLASLVCMSNYVYVASPQQKFIGMQLMKIPDCGTGSPLDVTCCHSRPSQI